MADLLGQKISAFGVKITNFSSAQKNWFLPAISKFPAIVRYRATVGDGRKALKSLESMSVKVFKK